MVSSCSQLNHFQSLALKRDLPSEPCAYLAAVSVLRRWKKGREIGPGLPVAFHQATAAA